MSNLTPTLHKPIPMETRVRFSKDWSTGSTGSSQGHHYGTVVGVSSLHVVFTYIVLLDAGIDTPEGLVRAVAVPGPLLESEEGDTNWRLVS